MITKSADTPPKRSKAREWLSSIVWAVLLATCFRWLMIEHFAIPSSSMEATLLVGDHILVSKLHYGARTPITPLQIPLTHQTIGSTGIPSYLDWIQWPFYRLPGFSTIKRGDPVVFNRPKELDKPIDLRTYYIKRCVGLPGEAVRMENMQVYIDEDLQAPMPGLQYRYYLQTDEELPSTFFTQHALREYMPVQGGYLLHTTPEKAEKLMAIEGVNTLQVMPTPSFIADPSVYPHREQFPWNEDHFGPITIPAKGMTIAINATTLAQYEPVIRYYEGHMEVRIEDDQLWLAGEQVMEYTFQQDYYFMLGDNRHNSVDSRFWGFVPHDHVVGKAICLLFSIDTDQPFWRKLRWKRCLRGIS